MKNKSNKYESKFHTIPEKKTNGTLPSALSKILKSFESNDLKKEKTSQTPTPAKAKKVEPQTLSNEAGVQQIRQKIAEFIHLGDISVSPINLLYNGSEFLAIEGTLLDYKSDFPRDRLGELKLIKHIASFHNTYGGYIIFGANESLKDTEILPCMKKIERIDFKKIRDLCREFLSSAIEIQERVHTVIFRGEKFEVSLMHIPCRKENIPVISRKDAKDEAGKIILAKEGAYIREGDNSITASNYYHWRILFGPRINPYTEDQIETKRIRPIHNDLPDRDFICPDFIGRQDFLARLFGWLTDDFTCVRVLAGEGGLGKTSIAFEFATEVSRSKLVDADAVIWLTAKKQQFRALTNSYEDLINSHFSTSRELFIAIAQNLGEVRENWQEIFDHEFPKLLRELSRHVKIFFVIDDLDSLDIDEQKRCIEVCQQLSGLGSRFLFTTRKNATASSSTAIEVEGLESEDYVKLILSWQERLKIKEISSKEIIRLRETTLGSPLYTESLLRLVKGGMSINEAIAKWRGNLGVEVRNAALKREVVQLGQEARRVLVTAAILGECSLAEIKQSTGYSDQTLLDSTDELQSLFLLHAPSIAAQPRFSISKNTRDLVIGLGAELIPEFNSFQIQIKEKRHKTKGENQNINTVGIAINQSMALLAAERFSEALQTIDEVSAAFKHKNKDLWSMRGRVLLAFPKPRLVEAKTAFGTAFDLGQRKPLFFGMWYDTQMDLGHFEAAVDVATWGIEASAGSKADWLIKRAGARLQSAGHQDKRGDFEHTISQLEKAADDFGEAASAELDLKWDSMWKENFYRTHDSLWTVCTRNAKDLPGWLDAIDIQFRSLKRGDVRLDSYRRLHFAITEISRLTIKPIGNRSEKSENLVLQLSRRMLDALTDAPREYRSYKEFKNIEIFARNFEISAAKG